MSGSPVSLEAGNAVVGQRVLHRIHEDLEGDGRDVSTGESALGDVLRFSDGGSDDLRLDAVKLEDLGDGLDQFDAVPSDVIDAADEGGNEGSTGARSEQGLVGREDQGDIGADTGLCETLHCFHAFCGHRDLDDDMRVKGSEDFAFCDHAFRIIGEDFLELDLGSMFEGDFCVIGNYPYNISSQIFFKVLDWRDRITCCSGMLQKEVAERIAAKPGSKTYGILSVLLQAWYDIEYLFTVDEHVFNPPPKVKSGVIRLRRNGVKTLDCDEKRLKAVVKTSFGQRRKTLRNSLRSMARRPEVLQEEIFNKRPEQLSVAEFVRLTNLLNE